MLRMHRDLAVRTRESSEESLIRISLHLRAIGDDLDRDFQTRRMGLREIVLRLLTWLLRY